jgi:hypothetical protein
MGAGALNPCDDNTVMPQVDAEAHEQSEAIATAAFAQWKGSNVKPSLPPPKALTTLDIGLILMQSKDIIESEMRSGDKNSNEEKSTDSSDALALSATKKVLVTNIREIISVITMRPGMPDEIYKGLRLKPLQAASVVFHSLVRHRIEGRAIKHVVVKEISKTVATTLDMERKNDYSTHEVTSLTVRLCALVENDKERYLNT